MTASRASAPPAAAPGRRPSASSGRAIAGYRLECRARRRRARCRIASSVGGARRASTGGEGGVPRCCSWTALGHGRARPAVRRLPACRLGDEHPLDVRGRRAGRRPTGDDLFRVRTRSTTAVWSSGSGRRCATARASPGSRRRSCVGLLRPRRRRERAVFFESFYGRNASANPRGIDRALARAASRRAPVLERRRLLGRGSGRARPRVVEGSASGGRSRAARACSSSTTGCAGALPEAARAARVADLARHACSSGSRSTGPDMTPAGRLAIDAEGSRWNALLAQNQYSARIFRSAYAFRGPIWQDGYPRNDVLRRRRTGAAVRAAARHRRPARAVVLYAPTWRDDRHEQGRPPRSGALRRRPAGRPRRCSSAGTRARSPSASDLRAERLVDVTSYPDIADLLLVADVLVTDYSSVMFDFGVTGKPMFFFTPDLAHYQRRAARLLLRPARRGAGAGGQPPGPNCSTRSATAEVDRREVRRPPGALAREVRTARRRARRRARRARAWTQSGWL